MLKQRLKFHERLTNNNDDDDDVRFGFGVTNSMMHIRTHSTVEMKAHIYTQKQVFGAKDESPTNLCTHKYSVGNA